MKPFEAMLDRVRNQLVEEQCQHRGLSCRHHHVGRRDGERHAGGWWNEGHLDLIGDEPGYRVDGGATQPRFVTQEIVDRGNRLNATDGVLQVPFGLAAFDLPKL